MQEQNIVGEYLKFDSSCHSVEEAANAIQGTKEDLVKNICMMHNKKIILTIVRGDTRASTSRVAKALGIEKPRIATPKEIQEHTGYPCGGVPSFSFKATVLIDPKVMKKENIHTSGGTQNTLIKISTKELQRASNATVVRVRK